MYTDSNNYAGTPYGERYCPAHCDAVLREHIWFWHENPPPVSSTTSLISKYLTSIGRGCNLILDIAPNMTGLLLQDDINSYQQFGNALDYMFCRKISMQCDYMLVNDTSPVLKNGSIDFMIAGDITLGFGGIEIREDIQNGQRIEKHLIEIYDKEDGKWYNLTDTANSLTIGNKRIQTYNVTSLGIKGGEIRITVLSYVGEQDLSLVKVKSVNMFDWTSLAQNELKSLDWNVIIQAGK